MIALVMSQSQRAAHGAPLTAGVLGGFEQDGDQDFDGTPGATMDWANAVPAPTIILDTPSTGGGDTSIAGDDNDPDDLTCASTGGEEPAKSNLLRAYVNPRVVGTNVFLDLAWVRASNMGSANVVYEFNQAALSNEPGLDFTGDCPIARTDGDLLVTYDFSGNPAQDEIRLWEWDAAGDEWDEMTLAAANARAAVNTAVAIPDLLVGGPAIPVNQFGEATLDLTGIYTPPTGPTTCITFGTTRVRARSNGNNFNGLSDRLPATGVNVSTCGQITIEKEVVGDGSVDFTFDPTAQVNGNTNFILDDDADGTRPNRLTFDVLPNVQHSVAEIAAALPESIANYTTTIVCNGGTTAVNNATRTANITVGPNGSSTCVFTNTRQTGSLTVDKVLSPANDPGKFNLQIDGVTDPDAANIGNGGNTGAQIVNTGNHTVGETAGTGTSLSDYTSTLLCTSNGQPVPSVGGNVAVGNNTAVACTFTNTRKTGRLTVNKSLSPTDDPGKFNLLINGVVDPNAANIGNGGSTGAEIFNTGTYTVSETAGTGTTLDDYTSGLECRDAANAIVPSVNGQVAVGENAAIVCTFTNTRETGRLTVNKSLSPTDDPGKFNLLINGVVDTDAANIGHGGSTGAEIVNTGTYTVEETAGTDTDLSDYATSLECRDQSDAVVPSVNGQVAVGENAAIVCTFTNSRETGRLTVVKNLEPANDPGLFNLLINGVIDTDATDIGDGGSTGAEQVATGTYTVTETAGTGTTLDDYASSLECRDQANAIVTSPAGVVAIGDGDAIVCTFTNTRETGTLTVNKVVSPVTDAGLFNLQIDGVTDADASDIGDGGSTGAEVLNTGTHTFGETAGTGTDLGDYASVVDCVDDQGAVPVGLNNSVELADGQNIVCTIINTRRTGGLTVVKQLIASDDPGKFNLLIDGAVEAANVGDNGTTGAQVVNTGLHTVAETAGTDTSLTDYNASLECLNGQTPVDSINGELLVGDGDAIVCTFTNTRKTGRLTVVKELDPANDPGKFNLLIDGAVEATNVGDGGTTPAQSLPTGIHTVAETAGNATSLANYTSALECRDQTDAIVPSIDGNVAIGEDQAIVCTFTNTRRTGRLTVVKELDPANDPGKFNLLIDGVVEATNVGDGGSTPALSLPTGAHSVAETAGIGTDITDYDSALVCRDQADTVVPSIGGNVAIGGGDAIVCTFTNTLREVYGNDPDPTYGEDPYGYGGGGGGNDPDPFVNDPVTEVASNNQTTTSTQTPVVDGQTVTPDPGAGTAGGGNAAGPVIDPSGELPRTGSHNLANQIWAALGLLAAGLTVMLAARRRNRSQA